jgi:serine protease Do
MNRRCCGVRVRNWTAVVALVVLVGAVWGATGSRDHAMAQAPAVAAGNDAQGGASYAKSLSKAFRDAAQKVLPAVVMIQHSAPAVDREQGGDDESGQDPMGNLPPEFRRFFKDMPQMPRRGMPGGGESMSMGSGVIIDPSGIVLTNNHVVQGGGKITVRLHDGRELTATDVKLDPKSDLAIFRLKDAGKLEAAKLGNSDEVQVGDWVLALGDPFGLEGTVTAGIVSAKGRSNLGITKGVRESFIQTDAAINPGNSGGPLVNLDGEIVGINTAISSRSGGNLGVGFCIPSNLAKWVSDQLIAQGSVRRSYLGVVIQPVSHELANQFGVEPGKGVVVGDIQPKSPAAVAGMKTGDVIVEFAGKPVGTTLELQTAVEEAAVGQRLPAVVLRDGKRVTLDVTTREQPNNYGLARGESLQPGSGDSLRDEKLGLEVSDLNAEVAKQLGIKEGEGVVITDVKEGGPAAQKGLSNGVVIVAVNKKPVKSIEDYRAAMSDQTLEKGVLLLIRDARGTRFVVVQP